jgi:hypothetical protein
MPNYRIEDGSHDGLAAVSWFCLGLVFIAAVAGVLALV